MNVLVLLVDNYRGTEANYFYRLLAHLIIGRLILLNTILVGRLIFVFNLRVNFPKNSNDDFVVHKLMRSRFS
jgi:hypothetical protein